jgi:hypothetical protein
LRFGFSFFGKDTFFFGIVNIKTKLRNDLAHQALVIAFYRAVSMYFFIVTAE